MNRIFKVIWSEARNAYVVVSELTKRQSKSCSTKKLLATLIAAGVFSMAGMHAPVSAAEVGLVANTHYAAIAVTDKNGNPNTHPGSRDYTKQMLTVYDQNGNPTEEKREYYVRNGFTVYIQKQEHVLTGSKEQELVIALVSGKPDKGKVMSSTQNIIDPLVNSNNENVTTVLGQSLNGTSLNTYIAAVNGGIDASSTWDYIIQDVNGTWVNVKDSTNASKLVELTRGTDGNYYYGSQKINIENVYFLKKGNVATPMSFVDSNGSIYTGTVRGLHNEYLMTGQDAEGNIYTYWGAKADDDNTLLANSGITVGQLNKSFDTLEANEQRLADADIKSIKLNETNKTINLIRNDIAETLVAGGLTLGSGGGVDGEDTYVTIANTDGTIKLPSGSKVVATASEDKKLTGLSINGIDYQLSGVDTDTTYTISSENGTGNVVKKYKITGSDSSIMEFVDTDTRVTSGSISYSGQEKGEDGVPTSGIKGTLTLGVNDGSSITITGLNDTTLRAGDADEDISVDEEGNPTDARKLTIYDTVGNAVVLNDIAKDSELQEVSSRVENNETSITNINKLLDSGFKVADTKSHEATIKLGNTITFAAEGAADVTVDPTGRVVVKATDTRYQITEKEKDVSTPTNVVKTYNFKEIDSSEEGFDFVDTDTKYTAGTGITIDPNNNNQISIIPNAVANSVSISYKANNETAKSVSLSDGLNFVQGDNVQISTGANGVVNISATDTNTYTTSASYDANTKTATFTRNDGKTYDLNLSTITSGLGSMSSWTAKDNNGSLAIGNNGVVKFVGDGDADVTLTSDNGEAIVTVSATDTRNTTVGSKNIDVQYAEDELQYTVNLKNDVELGSDSEEGSLKVRSSVGDVLISNGQIIGDKYAITNDGGAIFADGVISAAGDGTFRAANGSFTVFADGTVDSKLGDDGRFLATSDGLSVTKGSSNFVVTGDGVSLSAGKNALVVNADGTAIAGGLNVLGSKITNVAAGVDDTDAVNVSQLKAVAASSKTEVVGEKNINVNEVTAADGHSIYKVGLDNNVTLGSDTEDGSLLVKSSVGDVLISNGQIIGDKYAITNDGGAIFADGVISAAGDGTFRAANGSFTVFADGTVDSKLGDDGRFLATSDGLSVTKGSSNFVVTGDGVSLSAGKNALVVNADGTAIAGGLNVLGSKITNVAAGVDDTDAVNVGQLREAVAAGDTNTHIESATKAVANDNTVAFDIVDEKKQTKVGEVKITDIAKASDLGDVSKLDADLKNQGSNVTTVVDAVNKLNDKVGNLKYSVVEEGAIDDGDDTTTAIGKLNQALQNVSLEATAHNTVSNAAGDTNITISESTNSDGGTNYALALNKQKINLGNVIIEGEKGSITAKNVTAGKTSIGDAGVQFDGKTYIGENGINANDQNITNVAAGELSETSKDAVNGSQLYATNQQVNQNTANINSLDNRISKLGSRVNKVGAGAAALAALHPMDFDPDDKLSFAVGMGNYAGENAAAIGAFYRPNEKVMMSVGGTYGNDENMVNVGLSFALDRTNNVSNSRTAMAHEIVELRAHVAKQDQQIAQLTALVNKLVGKDAVKGEGVLFPDVPENHWAYEYINGLVQAGVIDGYPDGTFGGERSLTRYEYATMLYKAMLKGTILNRDIVKEFESEIARIRVDRISGNDNDANKIERVRVNYQNRDNYGTRIAK